MVRRVPGGWESLMDVESTLAVQCLVGEGVSRDLTHTHFSSLTVKNAIVDHFRDNDPNGRRPSVDTEVRWRSRQAGAAAAAAWSVVCDSMYL